MTVQETLAMINRLKQEFAVVRLLSADCARQLELQSNGSALELPYRCAEVGEVCCVIHRRIEIAGQEYTLELINAMPEISSATDHIGSFLQRVASCTTIAWRDTLTGAFSRSYYDTHPPVTGSGTCLAMITIDHLTQTGTAFGPRAAEFALHAAAATVLHSIRSRDVLVRYEPNTFLLIFPEIPASVFSRRLEDIRHSIAALRPEEYPSLQITVSIGGVEGHGDTAIAHAHAAMREAAETGNTVVMSSLPATLPE